MGESCGGAPRPSPLKAVPPIFRPPYRRLFRQSLRKNPPSKIFGRGAALYNSIASTSATKRCASSATNDATTLNTASEKPPTFRMSVRSGACVVVYG